jgi:hypothetical protein
VAVPFLDPAAHQKPAGQTFAQATCFGSALNLPAGHGSGSTVCRGQ